MADLVQREVIFSKDVDTRQDYSNGDFQNFTFKHRSAAIDIRTAGEIIAQRERAEAAATKRSYSLQHYQEQKKEQEKIAAAAQS